MMVDDDEYPLVMANSLLLNMAIDMVGIPRRNGGSFHSCVSLPEGGLLLPSVQCFQNRLIKYIGDQSNTSQSSLVWCNKH